MTTTTNKCDLIYPISVGLVNRYSWLLFLRRKQSPNPKSTRSWTSNNIWPSLWYCSGSRMKIHSTKFSRRFEKSNFSTKLFWWMILSIPYMSLSTWTNSDISISFSWKYPPSHWTGISIFTCYFLENGLFCYLYVELFFSI